MRRSRRVTASPPAGFPVYGLDGSWPGARWLEGFGDAIGDEVRYVRLAHQDPETGALVVIETCSRPLTDAAAARAGVPPLRTVAFDAGAVLANLTLPADSAPRPEGIRRAIVDHVDRCSGQYADWPAVTWRVDGVPVAAGTWWFAGGYAAVSDAIDGVYLAATAVGSSGAPPPAPDELRLARLRDGRAYGFELDQPLDSRMRGAAPGGRPLPERRPDWHADQLALLREWALRGRLMPGSGLSGCRSGR